MAYRRGHSPRRDCLLGRRAIEAHAHRIAQLYLSPLVLLSAESAASHLLDEGTLVIHLRSGDVASLNYDYYMTNPLCYYVELARQYRRAVVVTEPGAPHPLLASILALFRQATVVSTTARDDFLTLCMAPHLASSGVGTFAIAAALLSQRLSVFHCTDIFQDEHLNPRMIRSEKVQVRLQLMPGFVKQWLRSRDRLTLLRTYQPLG